MNLRPTRIPVPMHFICSFLAIFLFNFSCSKDSDTLSKKTSQEETVSLIEQDSIRTNTDDNEEGSVSKDDSEVAGSCFTSGGRADQSGLKTWCWEDVDIPSGASTGRDGFSDGQLALNIQCTANQVVKDGNRLKFVLNPTSPSPASWCPERYNMRSEIRTMPWNVDHPSGTEEWIGFSYTFGNTYTPDPTNNWVFYQAHEGTIGASPLLSLQIDGRTGSSYEIGEIVIVNASQEGTKNSIYGSNIVPKAGDTVDVVLHVIWGDENTGLLEVWLNGTKTVNLPTTRTIRSSTRVGGNSKFGIYKHAWRDETGVQRSAAQGVREVETFIGPLRMVTRKPGETKYKSNSFDEVVPR